MTKSRYIMYLLSPSWEAKRKAVLDREGMCRNCQVRPATQVHHLTYIRVGNEHLNDLAPLCKECHQRLHEEQEYWKKQNAPK